MRLYFGSRYPARLWVCLDFYDPENCAQYGGWKNRGWWAIDPGNVAYVLNTSYRNVYFYAEAADGAVWSGPYGPVPVYQRAFDDCNTGTGNERIVYTRHIEIRSDSYTVNLIP